MAKNKVLSLAKKGTIIYINTQTHTGWWTHTHSWQTRGAWCQAQYVPLCVLSVTPPACNDHRRTHEISASSAWKCLCLSLSRRHQPSQLAVCCHPDHSSLISSTPPSPCIALGLFASSSEGMVSWQTEWVQAGKECVLCGRPVRSQWLKWKFFFLALRGVSLTRDRIH